MDEKVTKDSEKATKSTKAKAADQTEAEETATTEETAIASAEQFTFLANAPDDLSDFKAKNGQIKGLENVDRHDFKIAVYQLLQSNSKLVQTKKAEEGTFYNTMTKQAENSIRGILLHLQKTRVKWRKPFKRGEKALCRSYDGKTGIGLPGGNCNTCPDAQWTKVEGGDDIPPVCRQGYNWLGLDIRNGLKPFRFTAISSGVLPTKNFITDISSSGYDLFCHAIEIKTEQTSNESGIFYIPDYKRLGYVTREMAAQAEIMLDSYKAMFEEEVALDEEYNITGEEDLEIVDNEDETDGDEPF